jgi:hypothetical protein
VIPSGRITPVGSTDCAGINAQHPKRIHSIRQEDFNAKSQGHSAAGRNPIFTTKDTKITKKNHTICYNQDFVSFVLFVVKKFCQK